MPNFYHSTNWSVLQEILPDGLIVPQEVAAADRTNPLFDEIYQLGVRCAWFSSQAWSSNRFGPYSLAIPLSDLLMPDLVELGRHHGARCYLSAPGRLARWIASKTGCHLVASSGTSWPSATKDERSKVQLDRKAIESPEAKSSVPIQILESEFPTQEPNGTVVEVLNINLRRLDVSSIIREIERHIAHWPNATVFVGHQKCEYIEPATAEVERIPTAGTPFGEGLPSVELVLKTAKGPLSPEQQLVAITSCGVLHETTLAGCDRRAFSNYIFGQVEVPILATDSSPIPPFDMARTMRLNPQNETVALIHAFLGMNIERVCHRLEEQDRQRRRTEEVKRLQKEADAIADLINQDFSDWRSRIQQVLSQTSGASDQKPSILSGDGDDLGGEGNIPATEVASEGGLGGGDGSHPVNPEPANSGPALERAPEGETKVGTRTRDPNRRAKGGGFNVDFRPMGAEEARAKYESNDRTIIVNLEHPQIVAALSVGGIEDPAFRRLAYEVAFSEYAIGLAVELARSGYFIEMRQPITEIRDTMNRLATRAAALYR